MALADSYDVLRHLTTPVVAITTRRGERRNGMITDGAVRAGIVPDVPRLSVYIHKFNFSHELVTETGRLCLHVLHRGQVDTVIGLGFRSGRDHDKMAELAWRDGPLGLPVLADCLAWFACEVVNTMDTGASTLFLAQAVDWGHGPGHEPMEPSYLRASLPEDLAKAYQANLRTAQDEARVAYKTMRRIDG